MDQDTGRDHPNGLLVDWSKWLITINVLAGTGCIIALKGAGEATAKVGVFFFAAILSFSLSAICSTLFVFLLAQQRLKKPDGDTPFLWLAKLQWLLFTTGLFFVLAWIAKLSKVM